MFNLLTFTLTERKWERTTEKNAVVNFDVRKNWSSNE